VLNHSFFKGCNGGDNGVGVRFVGHAKEKGRRITQAEMTLVLNGRHGGEALDNVGVEFTHAPSALGVFSLSAGTIASPNSSWRYSTDARLGKDSSGRSATRVETHSDLLRSECSLEGGGTLRSSRGVYRSDRQSWVRN